MPETERILINDGNETKYFIPAKKKLDLNSTDRIFRTCAYCRVSTDSEMQQSSFELQQRHYQDLTTSHPNWELKHIYADEGITGTSVKNRKQFNAMIEACRQGQYDLIVTKAVSRFARNLVDCIKLVRELKNLNPPVGVFFETDNLFTLSEDSELKLAILSTVAQGESEKKSESMNWSLQERFRNGRLLMPELLGYTRERDAIGRYVKGAPLKIIESEATIVRFIFDAFTAEYSMDSIADILNELKVPTKTGKTTWITSSIKYILSNERYCGKVLTWKTFTADVFQHTKRKNINNEREQYLYSQKHEAIISVEQFEAAQLLLGNLEKGVRGYSDTHVIDSGIFSGFVPVNPRWINSNPNVYFEASNSADHFNAGRKIEKSYFCPFNLSGYQVVRGHFLTAKHECPCITITDNHINFNIECVRLFSDISYVQLLIHPSERKIGIRPCSMGDVHSIRWRVDTDKPLQGKSISTPYFSEALYQIMNWNPDFQYHVRGTFVNYNNDSIIILDLSNAMSATYVDCEDELGKKHRVLLCPDEWQDSFGEEFYDFCLQNSFYYVKSPSFWNPQAKCKAVHNTNIVIPTP
ncbi:MAG: recombinase family protein, partial [Sphaerochaetaceae bacterium]|nr:recombinase family protein [Sphaerochaetaceae bacterium]